MPFIGRGDEILAIAQRLADPACCLLTLVGPGGIGKTRLAIEVAKQVARTQIPVDGIHFVDLQPVNLIDNLVTAIANSLGVVLAGSEDPRAQLLLYFNERKTLLLLDNFEQILEGADLVADVVKIAPGVKILVTSREALDIQEEWAWQVGGLQVPGQHREMSIDSYSAVQLFVERARRTRQDFTLTGQETHIMRICQLAEGMPLALELAAGWTKALSCAEIADEIQRDLDFLTTTRRNVPERHRSMQAVFDYSWRLLTDAEREAFPRLSVFSGGFRREAAEHVAGASLAVLTGLVDKSFLRLSTSGRYDVHELMRQYGEEYLATIPNAQEETQNGHSIYFSRFLYQRQSVLRGPDQATALDDIEGELDNVRLSWQWAVANEMDHEIYQSMHSLFVCCHIRKHGVEGEHLFALAVNRFEHDDSAMLAYLLLARTWMSWYNGRTAGLEQYPRAIRLAYAFWNDDVIALPLRIYFNLRDHLILDNLFDDGRQEQVYRDFLERFTAQNQRWGMAYMLYCLGVMFEDAGHYDEAERYARESQAIFLQIGDRWGSAWASMGLACALEKSHKYRESLQVWQEHQAICAEVGDRGAIVFVLAQFATLSWKLQDYVSTRVYIAQGIKSYLETGSLFFHLVELVWTLVEVLLSEERFERAVELMSFFRQFAGKVNAPDIVDDANQHLLSVAAQLPPDVYQRAIEYGKSLQLSTILDQLLNETSEYLPPSPAILQVDPLTERELEVLRLAAAGSSNRQIAQDLFLSLNTVKSHIHHIYDKLGVGSRSEAIARVRELDLL